jgi:hypothetical protein
VSVEDEDGAVVVDEGAELFGLGAGTGVDVEGHFSHGDAGDVFDEGGVGDAEDETADFEPAADELDVFDFGVGELDDLHLAFAADEDVAFEAPADFDVFGEEAKFADHFLPSEGIGGGDGEVDVDWIVFEHWVRESGFKGEVARGKRSETGTRSPDPGGSGLRLRRRDLVHDRDGHATVGEVWLVPEGVVATGTCPSRNASEGRRIMTQAACLCSPHLGTRRPGLLVAGPAFLGDVPENG